MFKKLKGLFRKKQRPEYQPLLSAPTLLSSFDIEFKKQTYGFSLSYDFFPDGRLLAIASPYLESIVLYNLESLDIYSRLGQNNYRSIAFTPDGKKLIAAGSNKIEIWDWQSGSIDSELKEQIDKNIEGVPCSLAISSNSDILAIGYSCGKISVWSLTNQKQKYSLISPDIELSKKDLIRRSEYSWSKIKSGDQKGFIICLCLSNEGNTLYAGVRNKQGRMNLEKWNTVEGTLIPVTMAQYHGAVYDSIPKVIIPLEDRNELIVGRTEGIYLFSAEHSKVLNSILQSYVNAVVPFQDAKFVLSGDINGHLLLWKIPSLEKIEGFQLSGQQINYIAIPPYRYFISNDDPSHNKMTSAKILHFKIWKY